MSNVILLKGIDASKYQKFIDWVKVSVSGIQFALLKAGYGNDVNQKDGYFDSNVANSLRLGLHAGAYWFSYAISVSDAQKEADACNQVLQPYKGKLEFPIAFDFEYDSERYFTDHVGRAPTAAEITAIADAFLSRLKSYGWFVNIYTNCDYIRSGKFSAALIAKYDVWLADYSGEPDYPCYIQQTGSKGTVPGIAGNVDMDVSFRDYPTLIKGGGYNGFQKQPQTVVEIDTTTNVKVAPGNMYTFWTKSNQRPAVTVGTAGVVNLKFCRRDPDGKDYWHLFATGKPGQCAGIYTAAPGESPLKRFVFTVDDVA